MNVRNWAVRGGMSAAVVGLVWAAGASAGEAEVRLVPECEVTVAMEQVPVQAEPVVVPVRHTAALGDEISATVDDESGAQVIQVTRNDDDEPMTLHVVLNTSEATAGQWAISLTDGEQQCTGTVTLVTPEDR